MIKHTQTSRSLLPTNHFSRFDHFVGLALKGLRGRLRPGRTSWGLRQRANKALQII